MKTTRHQAKQTLKNQIAKLEDVCRNLFVVAECYDSAHPDISTSLYETIELLKIANEVVIKTEAFI